MTSAQSFFFFKSCLLSLVLKYNLCSVFILLTKILTILSPAGHHVLNFWLCSHQTPGALCSQHISVSGDVLPCFTEESPLDDLWVVLNSAKLSLVHKRQIEGRNTDFVRFALHILSGFLTLFAEHLQLMYRRTKSYQASVHFLG